MALFKLYKEGRITFEEAIRNADSKNNLRLRINLDQNPSAEKQSEPDDKSQMEDITRTTQPPSIEAQKGNSLDDLSLVSLDDED